jgi:site-specific recombinase XerD
MPDFRNKRSFLNTGNLWDKEEDILNNSEEWIQQFVTEYSFRLALGTLENYEGAVRQLLHFCEKPLDEITTGDIRNWVIHLVDNGYKSGTISYKLYGLRLFYQYCLEENLLINNSVKFVPFPQEERKLPHYLETEQLALLRECIGRNVKQRAVMEVLYATGVRINELCSILKEDVYWSERMIHIRKGKGKKERIVLFTRQCEGHLNAYLQSRVDDLPFLFLNRHKKGPIHPRAIQHWFESYREKMGFYFTPHTMRHTFAAHLAMRGMSLVCIQTLLGHDHPRDTQMYARLYNHAQKQMYDEWM